MRTSDTVVITRPAGQHQRLQGLLEAAGYRVLHRPALRIEPLPVSDAQRRQLMELDQYHAVFFASANAAELALSAMADLWPQWPVGVHWLAVGRATAAVLEDWGMPAQLPAQGFNSETVLALPCLQALDEKKVLICRGEGGRDWLPRQLRERGAQVDTLAFYRRLPNRDFQCPPEAAFVMITSVEGWQSVAGKIPAASNIVVAGERVAQTVRQAFPGDVIVADSAHDEDMVAALNRQSCR